MSVSLRSVAACCLGVTGDFSLRRDVWGYIWGPMQRDLSLLGLPLKAHIVASRTGHAIIADLTKALG